MAITTEQEFLKNLYSQKKPKTYTQVADLFECNYQKILKLIPLIELISHHSFTEQKSEQNLHILVEQRTRYTGTYVLTHQIKTETGVINRPDIKFKIYFDAKLLEVISVCNETTLNSNHPFLAQCSDLNIQFELNTFMARWLDYCLDKYKDRLWQTL